jgi:HNH endonuclease
LLKARILNKCRMSDTGCWLWTGPTNGRGYGLFYIGNGDRAAHRISYKVFKGPIPSGLHVLHRCDTPLCVNPAHLRAGTVKENMADREARGRRDVRGEQIGTSKLTAQQVAQIKASDLGLKALAEQYGVKPTHIWRIKTGRNWAHVKPAETFDGR